MKLTGVIQLLSKCSESGLSGGTYAPFARNSAFILAMASRFSLKYIISRLTSFSVFISY